MYDEVLAERVREAFESALTDGVGNDDLMVQVGRDGAEDAVAAGARQAMMGERTMSGVVLVSAEDLRDEEALAGWVVPAMDRARAKPPKKPKPPRKH